MVMRAADADLAAPCGLTLRSFGDDATVHRFPGRRRLAKVTEFVLHETAGSSVKGTVDTLVRRKLGIHLIGAPSGEVCQHGDLLDMLEHVGKHNGVSVGIEVVNPYYPSLMPQGGPWKDTIDAPWAHALPGTAKRYVLPTRAQAEVCAVLAEWLTSAPAPGLEITRTWPGLQGTVFLLGPLADTKPRSGVWAHHQVGGHADGAWLALYTWLRVAVGLDATSAYDVAADRATSAKGGRVKVGDLAAAKP